MRAKTIVSLFNTGSKPLCHNYLHIFKCLFTFFLFGEAALTAIMRLALCKKAGKAQKLLLLLVVEMTALKTEKRGTTRAECSKHTE